MLPASRRLAFPSPASRGRAPWERDWPTWEFLWVTVERTVVEALNALAGRRAVVALPVALAVLLQTVRLFAGAALLGGGVRGGLVDDDLAHEGVGVLFEGVLNGLRSVVLVSRRSSESC